MNFTLTGKISTFGGPDDKGMSKGEGLAMYEHVEADMRPDLFTPRILMDRGVAARLRNNDAMYFAIRFPSIDHGARLEGWHDGFHRTLLQRRWFLIRGPKTGIHAALVDYGPHTSTGRMFDLSDALARALGVQTDDEVTLRME